VKGYWPAAWPGEDGGPRRLQAIEGHSLHARSGQLTAQSRDVLGGIMCIQRDAGELYFQGATIGPGSTGWVERIDPVTLECVARLDDLPAGPWWPGGMLAHANGDLYVTQGRWSHRVSADLELVASTELPRDRPYNSLLALDDGRLVMKDMSSDDELPSQLVVLDPDSMAITHRFDLPEGSIARLSATGNTVCVVGMHSVFALDVSDHVNEVGRIIYRTVRGQTFGWDAVLAGGSAWCLDNGLGTEAFSGSFVGQSSSAAPLHLVRLPWPPAFDGVAQLVDVCGAPGGIVANPPIISTAREGGDDVAVGYDSGHGVMTAWRWLAGSDQLEPLWHRDQNHAAHSIHYAMSGELVTFDYDLTRGVDQCVVLDIHTGEELGRVDTGSPIQSVVFPCPGWGRDCYVLSFTTLTRIAVR